ncbi:hypothetical protein [Piscinibacter defluvii]|uniref:hypothetical protein n=1 Tax=Piscinibacter defluvii TaxID=1796922 RepID=UPI000FDE6F5E|nr:hypothetical protein [Piscinibacter defluvii]
MKRLLFLFLLLWHLLPAQAAPACIPGLYGDQFPGSTITGPLRGDRGWYGWGWCRNAQGEPYSMSLICAHGECTSDIGGQVGRTMADLGRKLIGSTKREVYGAWWDANALAYHCRENDGAQVTEPSSPRGLACAELRALLAADLASFYTPPPPPPPPPVYTHAVKVNPACTLPTGCTRPVYLLANGVRGTAAVGRAEVGQPCDLSKPTAASGADVWASFGPLFETGKVALCARGTPAAAQ